MKTIVVIASTVALSGCIGLGEMKLRDGEAGCDTVTMVYGSASRIVWRADNVGKGASNDATTDIRCGNAELKSTSKIGVPVPPGATTTTTTIVKPAQ